MKKSRERICYFPDACLPQEQKSLISALSFYNVHIEVNKRESVTTANFAYFSHTSIFFESVFSYKEIK